MFKTLSLGSARTGTSFSLWSGSSPRTSARVRRAQRRDRPGRVGQCDRITGNNNLTVVLNFLKARGQRNFVPISARSRLFQPLVHGSGTDGASGPWQGLPEPRRDRRPASCGRRTPAIPNSHRLEPPQLVIPPSPQTLRIPWAAVENFVADWRMVTLTLWLPVGPPADAPESA
jgi:hypothetical protein